MTDGATEKENGNVRSLPTMLTANELFAGDGEMRALSRAFDWSSTSLGPVERWSQSLCTMVRTLLACRNPMFLWWGPELIQFYNDSYRPSLGERARHPAALGMPAVKCWPDTWPSIEPKIKHVMATGISTWNVDQFLPIARNGRLEDAWWTYSYSPAFDDDGSIAGTLVVCLETTERVVADQERMRLVGELEAERARLEETFRQSPSFLAVLRGSDNTFEYVNAAYEQLIGHGRDVVGKPLITAIPESLGQGFEDLLNRVRESGDQLVFDELPVQLMRTPEGPLEQRYMSITYLPRIEADGSHDAVIAHGSDVTTQVLARRRIEQLLEESESARAEAEAANNAKTDFLAVMSHELRTPLNAIGGYAELLELGIRGPVTPEQRKDLGRIKRSQRHLLGLINGLLNYAKLEAGAVDFIVEPVLMDEVLSTCESLVMPQIRANGLSLDISCSDQLPTAHVDREKTEQILLNLLSNAIKFTEPGGRIAMDCVEGDNSNVIVKVSDSGHGISSDQIERIFQPFVQLDVTLTRQGGGTGLGLAISRDLARGMGGDLSAESEVGVGSTFTLTLPMG